MAGSTLLIILLSLVIQTNGRPQEVHFEDDFDSDGFGVPKPKYCSVVFDKDSKSLLVKPGQQEPYVAQAAFRDTYNSTGWALLKLSTNESFSNLLQAQAAGIAEGYITAAFISMDYQNSLSGYCKEESKFCDKLKTFIKQNSEWTQQQIANNLHSSYWQQVGLIFQQLQGMLQGYNFSKQTPALTSMDFLFMQIGGDMEDLELALGKESPKKILGSGSCSALVKLFEKNLDLGISQVTWNDFTKMLRIYKMYNISLHHKDGDLISGSSVSFSSYPGMLYSGDDFHILSSGLVSQETTIGNGNADLWKYVQPETNLEWVRTMVANRLADTGNEWCSLFERYNSGTYNNQWMILDYKLFTPGKPLKPDTFWVLEQLPGIVHMADMSFLLQEQGYWASYNIPYFPYIYNISGVTESKKQYGDWFDYHMNPRAQIFKRDHNKVVDMQSFVKLMRYNDFKNDPIAKCNCTPPYSGENAISARSDLNPATGKYPFAALGHRKHGGTDCKATNYALSKSMAQFIVAGPTADQQPAFQWSKTEWKRPIGHPDVFHFEPTLLNWSSEEWIFNPLVE